MPKPASNDLEFDCERKRRLYTKCFQEYMEEKDSTQGKEVKIKSISKQSRDRKKMRILITSQPWNGKDYCLLKRELKKESW